MKIGLDATPLTVPTGGIQRYTRELAEALCLAFPEDEVWLLSDQAFGWDWARPPNLRTGERRTGLLRRRWWLCGLALEMHRLGLDVFHGTDFAAPYLPLRPSVTTVHDLSPWKAAAWRAPSGRVRARAPYLLGLALPSIVVTPSESVRREVIEQFRLHPSRVAAVPLAASPHFRPLDLPPPPAPYFLFVGTLEPRKNLGSLLAAWRQVRAEQQVDLVLIGRRREDSPELDHEQGLRVLGPIPDADLPRWYAQAAAVLLPSLYEGFGLPMLEAMQCGAPVIASSSAALVELSAGAALHVDAADGRGWVEAMRSALREPAFFAGLRERALRRAGTFSWAATARRTREVYDEAIRRFSR